MHNLAALLIRRRTFLAFPPGLWIGLVFCLWTLSACGTSVLVEPTAPASTNTPGASPQPPPAPTPGVDLSFSNPRWIESKKTGGWDLIGTVVNQEDFPVEEVLLNLVLTGSNQQEVFTLTSASIPATLQASSEALFRFQLPGGMAPSDFELSYTAKRSENTLPTVIRVNVLERRPTPDGRLVIRGEVENLGEHLLQLRSVFILLLDDQGLPLGIAASEHLLPDLAPHSTNPFIASTEAFIEADSWNAFVDASPDLLPPSSPLDFVGDFSFETTAQQQPFILGQVENRGVTPWWLYLNIVYRMEGQVLGMDTLELPFPLPPGERIAFVLDPSQSLPPEMLVPENLHRIEIQTHIDPWRTLPSIEELLSIPVALTQFEPIGNRLYLQGEITNNLAVALSRPAIYIAIDLNGKTRAVGWEGPLEDLAVGDSQTFNLNLLVPKNVDLNLIEFDLRTFGFPLE